MKSQHLLSTGITFSPTSDSIKLTVAWNLMYTLLEKHILPIMSSIIYMHKVAS